MHLYYTGERIHRLNKSKKTLYIMTKEFKINFHKSSLSFTKKGICNSLFSFTKPNQSIIF